MHAVYTCRQPGGLLLLTRIRCMLHAGLLTAVVLLALLLADHQMILEVIPPRLQPRDVQLLLEYMDSLPWNSMLPLLCDVSLHVAAMKTRHSMSLARLLLDKAALQLSMAAAAAVSNRHRPGLASSQADEEMQYGHLRRCLFSDLLCHDFVATLTPEVLSGLIKLGLQTDKVNREQQPLLHAALAARCSTAVAMLLLNSTPPEVMLHEDASHTYPLHYIAALPDLHEPHRMELLVAACKRYVLYLLNVHTAIPALHTCAVLYWCWTVLCSC